MNLYPKCDETIWLRTCEKEIVEPIHGVVTGVIPHWINGKLFRNGPGALNAGNGLQFGHLFDNFALISCFTIANGNVTYQCQFVKSEYYKRIRSRRLLITEFGTKCTADPCDTIFHRVKSIFSPTGALSDNTMVSIYPFADEMYALGESPVIYRINKDTLETEQSQNMLRHVGIVNHSAHPHFDYDGSIYSIGMSYTKSGIMHNVVRFPQHESAEEIFNKAHIVASIPSRKFLNPSYMHSFGITDSYFILVQQPLSMSILSYVKNKLLNKELVNSLYWDKTRKTRFDVISRQDGSLVKSFYAASLFFLHIINQYERKNEVVIDICCYDDASMVHCMFTEALKNMQSNPDYANLFRARPKRFVLPILGKESIVEGRTLCHLGCETPQIHYAKHHGRPYRYFYAINSDVDYRCPGTMIKVDVDLGHTWTWSEANCYPSEPIFVARERARCEDDGVLVSSLFWGKQITHRIGLLVLDARTMKEVGRCVFKTPSPAPKCLHGWFTAHKRNQRYRDHDAKKKQQRRT